MANDHEQSCLQDDEREPVGHPVDFKIGLALPPEDAKDIGDEQDKAHVGREACSVSLSLDLEALNDVA